MHFPQWDTDLFLFLNGIHSAFWDPVMWAFSHKFVWLPLYLVLLFWMIRKVGRKNVLWLFLCLGLTIFLSDFIASGMLKEWVARPRPSHEPTLQGLVHIVNGYKGGPYGFASSHSSNSFAFAMFVSGVFRRKWLTVFMLAWAAVVAYSRIYLGVHYPLDVFCGSLIGIGSALLSLYIFSKLTTWKN